ncbi:MAG: heparan-alpha-glucosaminide N-acetyltransferase domain-containing protein [Gemmatimonadaceae bacterium]
MESQIVSRDRIDPVRPARARIESVDVVRGVIMILMALDHTRDYFGDLAGSPTNLATTTPALFFTRWITHFCAPVFFLLTGTGAYLALARRGRSGLSRFLVSRGLWLIVLELTVMRFLWQFNVDYQLTLLTVFWSLGWAMITLAALVWLPAWGVTAFGVVLIATHNLLDGVKSAALGTLAPVVSALHVPGPLLSGDHAVFQTYVLVPWIGVTAVGYGLGQIFTWPVAQRRNFLLRLGLACVVAFIGLRAADVYGDPIKWSAQKSALFTLMSFINTNKYPPSLLFLLMTLGPALLLMRAVEGRGQHVLRPALIIGKVPFFYYVMHVVILHLATVVASYARYGTAHWMTESPTLGQYPVTQPPGWPAPLPVIYLVWIGVVIALYPMCRWFATLKSRRTDAWLSYL